MTPKEKAKELVDGMIAVEYKLNKHPMSKDLAKSLSLLCVREVIDFGNKQGIREPMMYWRKVKQEINKL